MPLAALPLGTPEPRDESCVVDMMKEEDVDLTLKNLGGDEILV